MKICKSLIYLPIFIKLTGVYRKENKYKRYDYITVIENVLLTNSEEPCKLRFMYIL